MVLLLSKSSSPYMELLWYKESSHKNIVLIDNNIFDFFGNTLYNTCKTDPRALEEFDGPHTHYTLVCSEYYDIREIYFARYKNA